MGSSLGFFPLELSKGYISQLNTETIIKKKKKT